MAETVKIISGWSNPGGSTSHHISLTNLLNSAGISCSFYGPHTWHLKKCRGKLTPTFRPKPDDILITHFMELPIGIVSKVRQHVLSCHETRLFPLQNKNLHSYDCIQFVSETQREWHQIDHPSVIIPPVVMKVNWKKPNENIAGVIGSIDPHKQPHLSILRALKDGYEKVLLFGEITDPPYFINNIKPLLNENIIHLAYVEDMEFMYNSVDTVYHSSAQETFGLVKAECELAGIPYDGLASADSGASPLPREEILKRWTNLLKL